MPSAKTIAAASLGILLALAGPAIAQHKGSAPHHNAPAPHQQQMHVQPPPQQQYYQPPRQPQVNRPNPAQHQNAVPHANAARNNAAKPNPGAGVPAKSHSLNTSGARTSGVVAASNNGVSAQSMHFPNNKINFPNENIHFPTQASNWPMPTLNFPSEASSAPAASMNFPSQNIHFPSYVTNFGVGAAIQTIPTTLNNASSRNQSVNNGMAAVAMGMPSGVAGFYHGVPHQYHYGSGYHYPYYGNARYRSANPNQLTPAQRHYRRVVADLDSLVPNFPVQSNHLHAFRTDLMALSVRAPHPGTPAVQQLATNLASAMTRRRSPAIDTASLAGNLQVMINAPHLNTGDVRQAMSEAQVHLREGGFSAADIRTITADLNALLRPAGGLAQTIGVR